MQTPSSKLKRQIEIVGLALNNERKFSILDLAELFHCEELTIKRDLHELRSSGVDIHSTKGKGISVERKIDEAKLKEFISQYIALSNSTSVIDKATSLLFKKQKERALKNIVTIQRCIDSSFTILADYISEGGKFTDMEISPLVIFQSEGYWRLLALNHGKIKQYHLDKLSNVRETETKFNKISLNEMEELFRFSWRSWIGTEKYTVKLQLSEWWTTILKPRQLMESQIISEHSDGSIILEITVNSLEEIASWIVSRGNGVKVIEPKELKERVINLANETLSNYKR
ncbi:MAG: transcriptional regulator [Ignavibacteriales bacterium]|nr:transcriptional regulator [Ignavibacteriales bacterium]